MVDECGACERPASHLLYRVAEASSTTAVVSLEVCQTHHQLARDYKALGQAPDEAKRREWDDQTTKERGKALGADLLSPDRDGTFRSRRLTNRERNRDTIGLERHDRSF